MIPLVGTEAQVFRLLTQVVAIGRHRRAWDQTTVARVAVRHLGGDTIRRDTDRERQRADRAEQEAQRLRERVVELEHNLLRHTATPLETTQPRHKRVAVLTQRQAQVFDAARRGVPHEWIAQQFGVSRTSVSNYVSRAAEAMEADNVPHALWLANSGVVEIRVKQRRGAA